MPDDRETRHDSLPRRSFVGGLFAVAVSWVGALLAIPVARLVLFPLRDRSSQAGWVDLGPVESFAHVTSPVAKPVNFERNDGWQRAQVQQSVYVVAGPGGGPSVFSSVCPHLGCTVQWQAEQKTFHCPCHGGTYAAGGSRLAGPASRGMDELPARVQDGHLFVKFQYFRQSIASKEVVE